MATLLQLIFKVSGTPNQTSSHLIIPPALFALAFVSFPLFYQTISKRAVVSCVLLYFSHNCRRNLLCKIILSWETPKSSAPDL